MNGLVEFGGVVFHNTLPHGEGFQAFIQHEGKAYLKTGHHTYHISKSEQRDMEQRAIWEIGEPVELDNGNGEGEKCLHESN